MPTISIDLDPKPADATAPHTVTLRVDGTFVASATGVDDVFALENLITKLRTMPAVDDGVIRSVVGTLNAAIGNAARHDKA